jgi:hypothetical protein
MKKIICLTLFFLAIGVSQVRAQCTTVIEPTPASGSTNNAVSFLGSSTNVATTYNFNGGVLPTGWTASPYTIGQPCTTVPTPDNSNYFWATTRDASGYRFVQTNALNVSYGGTISFLLRLASTGEVAACEQPDEPAEGVKLQYSTDGTNWVDINYWQPQLLPSYILWTSYNFDIPVAAKTTSTRFRWIQFSSSGDTYDNWGLDDVTISATDAVDTYTWNIAGTAYTTQTANHTFPGYGSYSVSLATHTTGGCSDTESITYVVNSVPTLNAIADQGTYVAAGSQNVSLSGISDGGWGNKTLSVTATSSNTAVVPNPAITYTSANTTGTLTYTPSTNGTTVITVTVSYFNVQTVTFSRTFNIIVNAPPANPTSVSVSSSIICNGFSTQLTANGAVGTVYWYTGSCGGTQVTTGNPVTVSPTTTTTYYARNYNNAQFSVGCASASVTVNQPSFVPPSKTVGDLQVSGSGIKWYDDATGGNLVSTGTALSAVPTTYYASQTVSGVESSTRFAVVATVDPTPCKPTGSATQTRPSGATVASLTPPTGSNIRWYFDATGGPALDAATVLVNGHTYHATQTVNCTESAERLAVTVTVGL